jgi:CheY-like chemotaxis protein
MIDDLLDLVRIREGRFTLELQETEPERILRATVDSMSARAQARGVRLRLEAGAEVPSFRGDPIRVQQIVRILLDNALKFTPEGGWIESSLTREHDGSIDGVLLQIKDSGPGIRREDLPLLFTRGAQLRPTAQHCRGLGLGLFIARSLVSLHGGRIWAASEGPGKGATFSVFFPVSGVAEVKSLADCPQLAGVKVLVVDSDKGLRESLASLLSSFGARVWQAGSGPEALGLLQGFRPDVLLCDLFMPGMDGIELIRRIREMPSSSVRRIPARALTGNPSDSARALEAGFQDQLPRRCDSRRLAAALQTLTASRA